MESWSSQGLSPPHRPRARLRNRRSIAIPPPPSLPAADTSDCDDPTHVAAVIADPEGLIVRASAYGLKLSRLSERPLAWRIEQLIRAGRWALEDQRSFGLRIVREERIAEEVAWALNLPWT